MSRTLQFRRYSNTALKTITGANGEIIVDNTNYTLTVHDGTTPGGVRIATEPYVNTAISLAQYAANTANSDAVLAQAAFNTANSAAANSVYLFGVDLTQNTNITNTDAKMQSAYNKANNALANGTLTYATTGLFAAFAANSNTYQQVVLQNSNTGTQASADFVVSNFYSTDVFLYGDFGINGPNFAGAGSLAAANNVYLYASNTDLVIGTSSANAIHFVVNGNALDSMNISSSGTVNVAGNLYAGSGIGYATGSGGIVTQSTNRTTGVTLNKPSGQITLFSQAMANTTSNTFVFTNSTISANDFIMFNHWSGGTIGNYTINCNTGIGIANVTIRSANTVLAEAPVLQYIIIKGAAS
jgi:hypothetical protein